MTFDLPVPESWAKQCEHLVLEGSALNPTGASNTGARAALRGGSWRRLRARDLSGGYRSLVFGNASELQSSPGRPPTACALERPPPGGDQAEPTGRRPRRQAGRPGGTSGGPERPAGRRGFRHARPDGPPGSPPPMRTEGTGGSRCRAPRDTGLEATGSSAPPGSLPSGRKGPQVRGALAGRDAGPGRGTGGAGRRVRQRGAAGRGRRKRGPALPGVPHARLDRSRNPRVTVLAPVKEVRAAPRHGGGGGGGGPLPQG
ncbi:translation initiation factor IF-2-like [Acinonyx jubatus]|uniref:Translation initiation factor IF-2-like n=1 Tax=Acinonyx jubatus TaxID=32536 RepID=A0ABM3Q1H2_ACIJB|nr:translation initiation factor IF-2-like [Acinonyx jubatus]